MAHGPVVTPLSKGARKGARPVTFLFTSTRTLLGHSRMQPPTALLQQLKSILSWSMLRA